MRLMRPLFLTSLMLGAVALTGCQTMDRMGSAVASFDLPSFDMERDGRITVVPQGQCPAVANVAELSSLYQFANPARPSDTTKLSEGHITRVTSNCTKQGGNLKVDIDVNFDGGLGPKGRLTPTDKPAFAYPYFVAITNMKNQILSKEIFAVSFAYEPDENMLTRTESISQVVPLEGEDPSTYRILIGFQLAPEELAYNRKLPTTELGKNLSGGVIIKE